MSGAEWRSWSLGGRSPPATPLGMTVRECSICVSSTPPGAFLTGRHRGAWPEGSLQAPRPSNRGPGSRCGPSGTITPQLAAAPSFSSRLWAPRTH